jgi:VanZ family protein
LRLNIPDKQLSDSFAEKVYRISFYFICILVLFTAVIKLGADLDKKVGLGELKIRLDHLLHAIAYFVFSLYYLAGRRIGLRLFDNQSYPLFFFLLCLLGLLAEILQIWVPYRSFSLMDMLSNLVGIVGGYVITLFRLKAEG